MNIPPILEVILACIAVTIGAELLVRGASALALRMGLSPLFVGLTVVGFGTSTPELGASMSATLNGVPAISVGNVVGSNILNIALILGLTALIRPISVVYSAIQKDLRVAIAASSIPLIGYLLFGSVTRSMGILSVLCLVAYVYQGYRRDAQSQAADNSTQSGAFTDASPTALPGTSKSASILTNIVLIVIGLFLLIFGAERFVHGATLLARTFGVSELVIGLTIVALGTSLPELVTSLVASYRKSSDIAVGNIVGSNIFNMLGILGLCSIVAPQPIPQQTAWMDAPVMLLFSLLLFPMVKSGGIISRKEGGTLLVLYVAYLGVLAFY